MHDSGLLLPWKQLPAAAACAGWLTAMTSPGEQRHCLAKRALTTRTIPVATGCGDPRALRAWQVVRPLASRCQYLRGNLLARGRMQDWEEDVTASRQPFPRAHRKACSDPRLREGAARRNSQGAGHTQPHSWRGVRHRAAVPCGQSRGSPQSLQPSVSPGLRCTPNPTQGWAGRRLPQYSQGYRK